ncbi:hypothetical protein AC812_02740 [Bellilinea caldifistulae]|uniref:Uncharacterized protein n=1 Tax=Bellilinea caldifistulae TaxID=360411 RepID=A0A0P6XR90_9CHLR|nr:hypothetical protein AC812_02740 [Bellilinea caldifistulae]
MIKAITGRDQLVPLLLWPTRLAQIWDFSKRSHRSYDHLIIFRKQFAVRKVMQTFPKGQV